MLRTTIHCDGVACPQVLHLTGRAILERLRIHDWKRYSIIENTEGGAGKFLGYKYQCSACTYISTQEEK